MAGLSYLYQGQVVTLDDEGYVNPPFPGSKLNVRTGTGINDVLKYGLTSDSSATKYCPIAMNVNGTKCHIGRYETQSGTVRSESYTVSTYTTRCSMQSLSYSLTETGTEVYRTSKNSVCINLGKGSYQHVSVSSWSTSPDKYGITSVTSSKSNMSSTGYGTKPIKERMTTLTYALNDFTSSTGQYFTGDDRSVPFGSYTTTVGGRVGQKRTVTKTATSGYTIQSRVASTYTDITMRTLSHSSMEIASSTIALMLPYFTSPLSSTSRIACGVDGYYYGQCGSWSMTEKTVTEQGTTIKEKRTYSRYTTQTYKTVHNYNVW